MQDAYVQALETWARDGVPARPGAWLTTVARRLALNLLRRAAHARGEAAAAARARRPTSPTTRTDAIPDDRLRLVFTCCHPALAREAQVALTLRLVCGVATPDVAHAFLVSEPTMAARITRAKKKIAAARIPYAVPDGRRAARAGRRGADRHPPALHDRSHGARRRRARARRADRPRARPRADAARAAAGRARGGRAARAAARPRGAPRRRAPTPQGRHGPARRPGPRARGTARCIAEADAPDRRRAARPARPGASRCRRRSRRCTRRRRATTTTDWPQILALYDELLRVWPSPVVALNRAVALVDGRRARRRRWRRSRRSSATAGSPATATCRRRRPTCCTASAATPRPPPPTARRSRSPTTRPSRSSSRAAGVATTAAEAQVATASGRSASATPARSGWSRSIATVPGVVAARGSRGRSRPARPTGRRTRPAARGGCGARAARASRARASPRTGRRARSSRCRSRSARRRRGRRAPGSGRRRGCPRSSGRRRRSCRSPASRPTSASLDVDAVDQARARAEEAGAVEQLDRRDAVLGAALLELARLLVGVDVADEAVLVGVGGDRLQPARRHGADAVRGDADVDAGAPVRPGAQRVDAREVGRRRRGRRSGAGRACGRSRRPSRRGGRRRGAGRSRSPARARRLGDRDRHRVRVLVRRAVGPVVDVVELADRAVAGRGHLGVDAPGRVPHRRRVVRAREPVHRLAPGPEVVGGVRLGRRPLGGAAQVALERVRVAR